MRRLIRRGFLAIAIAAALAPARAARADGVAQVLTSKTIPPATVAVIDPESGIFYATATGLTRNPANVFITFKNGALMNPEPFNLNAITGLLGTTSPVYTHDAWDWAQVRAYGISNPNGSASGNGGTGNTPF